MRNIVLYISICIFAANGNIPKDIGNEDTLELLHVIFRHGDRTPDRTCLYPNDPYKNVTYYPVGWGELTNTGKLRAYNIGLALREKYGNFLGDVYAPSLISPISPFLPRCRASLELVLAALFAPKRMEVWNEDLEWQPIPITHLSIQDDYIFFSMYNCPNYEVFRTENQRRFLESRAYGVYSDLLNYLAENSGFEANFTSIALMISSTLLAEQTWGYKLPAWTDSVWPEPLTTLGALEWEVWVGGDKLRTLLGGTIMSKIVNDTYSRINNDPAVQGLKLYLYSGNDLCLAFVLSWLGVFQLQPHQPPYGAYITIEVHNINGVRVIKIFYQDYSAPEPQLIWIPNCGPLCPIDQFAELYEPFFNIRSVCGRDK